MKALKCYGHPDRENRLIMYIVQMQDHDNYDDNKPISLVGALLAQEILHFNKPIKLVNSILNTDSEKMAKLLSDPRGCHITDEFMASVSIGEKSREGLLKILTPKLPSLACTKHGSRTIDAMLSKGSPKLKETLAAKLSPHESKLISDQFGKFICNNLGLSLFKRSKDMWLASFDKKQKTKTLFKDFIKNEKKITSEEFVIDKVGDNSLKRDLIENESELKSPQKKAKKSSYLDDL